MNTAVARQAWLLLAGLALFWGVNWPIIKIGAAEVPVFTFRAIASLVGGAGLFLLARASGISLRIPRAEWRGLVIAALFNITAFNILMLYGVSMMQSGRAAILAYTMPLWATLLSALLLGERIRAMQGLGLGCGLAGMAVLLVGDARALGAAPLGALVMIAGAVSWAAGTVAQKHYRFTSPTTAVVAWQQVVGGVPNPNGALLLEVCDHQPVSLPAALAVAYNATVTAIFCYWAWFRVVAMVPVVVSTVGTLMVPIVGVLSGALVLGEQPGVDALIALTLVLAAILAVLLPRAK